MKHTKGDTVNVYQKPLTKDDYEGEAKLISKNASYGDPPNGYEYWNVVFISDSFHAVRLIKL